MPLLFYQRILCLDLLTTVFIVDRQGRAMRLTKVSFVLLGFIWGSNFIYMKWAAALISPMQKAAAIVLILASIALLQIGRQRAARETGHAVRGAGVRP
ncbi:hypothetical protein [Burkholderia diffusa]|uniref:hypothetical protein n=1 Tax=Burkholderia diffusa TaxID=488732 RepID=UPI002ABE2D07|nr:hypothetical protein [Burkholderia diffusa]